MGAVVADHPGVSIVGNLWGAAPVALGRGWQHRDPVLFYHTYDQQEARQLLENDPYFKAGFDSQLVLSFLTPVVSSIAGKNF